MDCYKRWSCSSNIRVGNDSLIIFPFVVPHIQYFNVRLLNAIILRVVVVGAVAAGQTADYNSDHALNTMSERLAYNYMILVIAVSHA